jgi:hypothetical protein
MADGDFDPHFLQLLGNGGGFHIRSGYDAAPVDEDFRQTAHADSADPGEVDPVYIPKAQKASVLQSPTLPELFFPTPSIIHYFLKNVKYTVLEIIQSL